MENSFSEIAKDLLPPKTLVSVIFMIIAIVTTQYFLFYTLSLISFILFNYKGRHLIKKYISMLFNKPSVVNIKND
jgi:hypothetical protein